MSGAYGLCPLNDMTCELRKMYFLAEIRGISLNSEVLERAVNHAPSWFQDNRVRDD